MRRLLVDLAEDETPSIEAEEFPRPSDIRLRLACDINRLVRRHTLYSFQADIKSPKLFTFLGEYSDKAHRYKHAQRELKSSKDTSFHFRSWLEEIVSAMEQENKGVETSYIEGVKQAQSAHSMLSKLRDRLGIVFLEDNTLLTDFSEFKLDNGKHMDRDTIFFMLREGLYAIDLLRDAKAALEPPYQMVIVSDR